MPVPIPVSLKQPPHSVVKQTGNATVLEETVQSLSCTLPVAPTGPPPSFGTRQEWIESLPSWRRSKPRKIWEDNSRSAEHSGQRNFPKGLTAAVNAHVIKGARAEACIPPLPTVSQTTPYSNLNLLGFTPFMAPHVVDNRIIFRQSSDSSHNSRNSYSPLLFHGDSPDGLGSSSSPEEPATPFGEYVDRAMGYPAFPTLLPAISVPDVPSAHQSDLCGPECYQIAPYAPAEQVKEQLAVTEIPTPSATAAYRKLAEPLADWVANYVWKVCSADNKASSASITSPNNLADSVHSLLLSTLLQPSAVFLAIWYITRLPVQFGVSGLSSEHVSKLSFRAELFGDATAGTDAEAIQANAPFRLILLGFMLANKWLDDHTFSNKTWHTISSVPIQSLNKLESLALDIFSYDLSVSNGDWANWLQHILTYHASLSPSHQQPISRPSANPHSIIRKTIEELIQTPVACPDSSVAHGQKEPVFLGLEERRREKEQAMIEILDIADIDLDEDGPLREEYLPKRRSAFGHSLNASSTRPLAESNRVREARINTAMASEKLPPPAKWSPAGDEPILRERNKAYVAVQPPLPNAFAGTVPCGTVYYTQDPNNTFIPRPKPADMVFAYDPQVLQLPYQPYPFPPPMPLTNSRSLSYGQDNSHANNRSRTYSQSRLEYWYSDIGMTTNEFAPMPAHDTLWGAPVDPYAQQATYYQAFYPCPTFLPPWLRN